MNDKTSNKPLNCPLCGSLSGLCITDTREYIRAYTGKIQCSECDLMLQMTSDDVSELRTSLIKTWNTRKPMERIMERLEELYKYNEEQADIYKDGNGAYMREKKEMYMDRANCYGVAIRTVKEGGGIE